MKITGRNYGYAFLLFLFLLSGCKQEPITTSLKRSIPEAENVSSQGIIDFLDAAAKSKHEFHSLMIVRHGKVIAEGWWNPYNGGLRHTLYSTSKSFTATAVGFAVSEKKITVDDKVVSFFPDALPDTISPFLASLKIKDLLTMSAGMEPDPTFNIVSKDSNWVKSFLATPILYEPGTKFLYNSLATYMLSAIVQKATGVKVVDYLKPRLFDPLSITGMDWEVDPGGINTGGWGLRLKTEDMAKFGQLFLQKGKWNGQQILPVTWIEEATTKKIDQAPDAPQAVKDSSDWMQGYCYQMWRCRNNCYRGDGAYGQYIIVLPEKDAVIAITCETADMQSELNLVWDYLLPALKDEKVPENKDLAATLQQRLESLSLPKPVSGNGMGVVAQISGRTFTFEPNDRHVESANFSFADSLCNISMVVNSMPYNFSFGLGKWAEGETALLGPNLLMAAKAHFTGFGPSKVAGSFAWKNENTLELVLRYIESPHSETITCKFEGKKIAMDLRYSNMPDNVLPELKGYSK
jgi:CubicO group peptidase (beta-lactamase class C family)